ncbi:MAG: NAD(P)H-quinone oxidoreductase [Clostridia bacterium]|nr:NAD(P)H-quinone oxidoreductase [Clostridia bacterium]
MRAVVLESYGGPEVLRVREIPDPAPSRGEVLVRVSATALNRADVLQRQGHYPPPGPRSEHEVPGLEFAGIVEAVGESVTAWRPGDRVFGLLTGGGYAERVVTHERMLLPVPQRLSLEEAAAVPEVFFTAYDALAERASLRVGDVVLVHSGGSGVGTAAIQLARAMGAGRILTTVGSEEKARRAEELGADRAILYRREAFEQVVLEETAGRGADVILDTVGLPYLEGNLLCAALEGRLVLIATMGGARGQVDLRPVLGKRLRLVGTTLRARPLEQKMALTQRFAREVLPLLADGRLRPVIDRVFPLEEVAEAHRHMEANRNFGKIVLRVS